MFCCFTLKTTELNILTFSKTTPHIFLRDTSAFYYFFVGYQQFLTYKNVHKVFPKKDPFPKN